MSDPDKLAIRVTDRFCSPGDLLILGACLVFLVGFVSLGNGQRYGKPPDFGSLSVEAKKQVFFDFLSPIVSDVNAQLANDRDRIKALRARFELGTEPGWLDRIWLNALADSLEVPLDELQLGAALEQLERRAGVIPRSLVLAQAAMESGWGTSRFALEGNNFFGQRCYEPGCGITPLAGGDSRFGLARFSSVAESVESYIMNLNTHPQYHELRELRQSLRDSGRPVTGLSLVQALDSYSERGVDYVAEIAAMIRANDLE